MTRSFATLAAVLLLALAGCGGGDSSSSSGSSSGGTSSGGGGGGEQLALTAPADGSLKFDKTSLDAKAGTVTIDFDNPSSVQHGVEIDGNGVQKVSDIVTKGKTSVTADLKPGTYEYFCPVTGHKEAGMKGTLTVK
ncbi:MAG TPA: plastocyanin/azurin family copper-binding protein [Solirubrobacteraceae bacterium]|nr:plastocyanin/azurin family copper-binding protein [Solirubrobacteraceae bacterium]